MAKRTETVSKLILKVVTGTNADGTEKITQRSFKNLNPELTDDQFLAVGKKLGSLQSQPVACIARQDTSSLAAE